MNTDAERGYIYRSLIRAMDILESNTPMAALFELGVAFQLSTDVDVFLDIADIAQSLGDGGSVRDAHEAIDELASQVGDGGGCRDDFF